MGGEYQGGRASNNFKLSIDVTDWLAAQDVSDGLNKLASAAIDDIVSYDIVIK